MAKQQQQQMGPMTGQQRSKQPRGSNLESMLIQGEAGLNETMDFNAQFIANPMMQAINNTFARDAAKGNLLQKNIQKGSEKIDTKTGELVKTIGDRKIRNTLLKYTRNLKGIFANSGGQGMDVIEGEFGDLERATELYNNDKKAFSQNLNGPKNSKGGATEPHYSAGTDTTTLNYNARVYGEDYDSMIYNNETKEYEWTLTTDAVTFDDLETEEDRRKGRNLQGFVDRGRELTPEQQADYDRLKLKVSPASSVVVTQSMLNQGVVLKDAGVTTAIEANVTTLIDLGTNGKPVTRDDSGNVMVPGFDLNRMTNDSATLITMAWDNHLNISGGKTFVEHWSETHKNDDMKWARQGDGFDQEKLKKEVTKYYQMKMNKQYENGVANYKDNTQGGMKSTAIDAMVDNAFYLPPESGDDENETNANRPTEGYGMVGGMRFDVSSIVGDNGNTRMGLDEDGNFEIQVYDKTSNEFIVKDVIDKSVDMERFKRTVKIYFGSSTAY